MLFTATLTRFTHGIAFQIQTDGSRLLHDLLCLIPCFQHPPHPAHCAPEQGLDIALL